jgi:peptidylprolyl isomerase
MQGVQQGDTVKVHYTGTLDSGEVFDSSIDGEPLQFTVGNHDLIAGFEQAVLGMLPGDEKTTKISAVRAYGNHQKELVVEIDRKNMSDDTELQIGQRVQINQPDGQEFVMTVADLTDDKVTLDANHPLAGKDLTFDISLIEIVSS